MISIAVCDDNEITAEEVSKKAKQYCPVEAEISVFYHTKDILFSIHNENKIYNIVLMDIEFDASSGIEASKQINAWHPDCQIIYILQIIRIIFLLFMKLHIFSVSLRKIWIFILEWHLKKH